MCHHPDISKIVIKGNASQVGNRLGTMSPGEVDCVTMIATGGKVGQIAILDPCSTPPTMNEQHGRGLELCHWLGFQA